MERGDRMWFSGRSYCGKVTGEMPVVVIDPHVNRADITDYCNGQPYEGERRHIPRALVERPALGSLPARQFLAPHYTLRHYAVDPVHRAARPLVVGGGDHHEDRHHHR